MSIAITGLSGGTAAPVRRQTYSIDEAAVLLGVGRNSAFAEAKTGKLCGVPIITVGKRKLIPRAAFDRMLAGVVA